MAILLFLHWAGQTGGGNGTSGGGGTNPRSNQSFNSSSNAVPSKNDDDDEKKKKKTYIDLEFGLLEFFGKLVSLRELSPFFGPTE